ncbi:ComK protein [Anaerovirgula multivorans]|uniref:ComK protein n=1 Tax=Anaerovirgula multivorans TaxID=312168 RepID=A0A239G3R9_9FIRM|nr:hypothetical protein [Anaerovirgula multivorans]SNS62684.1 ComK protein [Anaerovirgula multivorans]
MKSIEKILDDKQQLAALIPFYEKDLGNATKLLLTSGQEILYPHSIDAALKALCSYYALHLRLLRRKQQSLLNCKYYTPLPIHKELLLFPIKTRVPKIKNDSSIGYINYLQVKKVDYSQSAIQLNNGQTIYSLNTPGTLKKRYNQVLLSAKYYEENHPSEAYVSESRVEYLYPLTKRDMEPLVRELTSIRNMLAALLTLPAKK